ncbi:MAG TPA: Gfo/Idh/MocA family oxidoreductase [Verrucomicrobiae bacterium]|jgi:predicted dehydrogenase|nr:Gfo/Idh/MocA family oxidoreductase [Verrucomicrobiae bacterium]
MNQEQNNSKPQDGGATRREFLKKSTLAAAAVAASANIFKTPVYGQNTAPSAGRVIGANDRLQVGYIGTGGQGMAHVNIQHEHAAANNIVQIAACDLSETRRQNAKAVIGADCKLYNNHEELLANPDIDAVTIATVDHWHCRTAMAALEAGKHVYVEKPMTRYLQEAFDLHDTVKKTGKILQVGSQGCTAAAWHKAAELIQGNKIGTPVWAQGYYCRNNPKGEWNYDIQGWCVPGDLNWDKWQEPVKDKKAFDPDSYFRWRKYYPYCAGLLGDLVPHRLLPLMLATGKPEYPVRVCSLGAKNCHTDKNTPNTPERDCPEQIELLAEFPSGMQLLIVSSSVAARSPGFSIYGHEATLEIGDSGERVKLIPEKPFSEDIDLQTFDGLSPIEDIGAHEKNWFSCIRSNSQPNAGIDLATKAQVVISLAEMSNRLNMMCVFDESTRKVSTMEGKEVAAITYGTLARS